MGRTFILTLILALAATIPGPSSGAEELGGLSPAPKWIISSGHPSLPAGSLLGIALAVERGASSLWLNLVLSADDQPVLLPDTRIDQSTDVKTVYPDRSREDGGFYSYDFTLDELQQLSLSSTVPEFTPAPLSRQHLPVTALEDVLSFVDLVSADLDTPLTLICVLKHGWRHQQEGKDLGTTVLEALTAHQPASEKVRLTIASYDPEELQQARIFAEPGAFEPAGFMQLIGANDGKEVQRFEFGAYRPYSYDLLFTTFGLKAVSGYADTIGLDPEPVFDESVELIHPRFLDDAHTLGLRVVCQRIETFPWQRFNHDAGPEELFEYLLFTIGFDGIVTAEDRRARIWLAQRSQESGSAQYRIIERLIDHAGQNDGLPSPPVQSDATR